MVKSSGHFFMWAPKEMEHLLNLDDVWILRVSQKQFVQFITLELIWLIFQSIMNVKIGHKNI